MKKTLLSLIVLAASISANAQTVSDFENIKLDEGTSYWNGVSLGDGVDYSATISYKSGSCYFPMSTSVSWGYGNPSGFIVSKASTDDTFATDAPFASITGKGANGSAQYVACTIDPSVAAPRVKTGDSYDDPKTVTGCYITCTVDLPYYLENGRGFLDRNAYTTGDWLGVKATGFDAEGKETGSAVIYLADYRDESATQKWLTDWTWFDLSGLGAVKEVEFKLVASENHVRSFNQQVLTTASFCMDDFNGTAPATEVKSISGKTVKSTSIYTADGKQVSSMSEGVNAVVTVYEDGTVSTKKVMK